MLPSRLRHFQPHPPVRPARIIRVGFWSSRLVSILLLAFLALLYVAQNTRGATKQIESERLRAQADILTQDNKQLELEALRAQALANIEQAVPSLELEPVNSVEYPTASPSPSISPTPGPN